MKPVQWKLWIGCLLTVFGALVDGCGTSSPSRYYVYTNFPTRAELGIFSLTASTAALVAADPSSISTVTMPAGMAASASGAYLAVTSSTAATVTLYTIASTTGQLTPADSKITGTTPGNVLADASNRAFYVANSGSGTISVYTLSTSASTLTLLDTETASSGVTKMVLSASGRFLYAMSAATDSIHVYSVASTGALTAVETVTLAGVSGIAIHPTKGFFYATSSSGVTVTPYSVDATTGTLTALTAFTLTGTPTALAIDPVSGSQIYVAISNGTAAVGAVRSLTVDASTGLLTALASTSVATQPTGVWLDAAGQSVLVLNTTSGSISVFTRNTQNGALSETVASPILLGSGSGTVALARR